MGKYLSKYHSVDFQNVSNVDTTDASNITSGTLSPARVPAVNLDNTGLQVKDVNDSNFSLSIVPASVLSANRTLSLNTGDAARTIYVRPTYSALLTQSGTDAPTAVVLENTLGDTVVWTRDGDGVYFGTLVGAFGTTCECLATYGISAGDPTADGIIVSAVASGNFIALTAYGKGGGAADMNVISLSIRVTVYA